MPTKLNVSRLSMGAAVEMITDSKASLIAIIHAHLQMMNMVIMSNVIKLQKILKTLFFHENFFFLNI